MAFANAATDTLVGVAEAGAVVDTAGSPAEQINAGLESLRLEPGSPLAGLATMLGNAETHLHSLLITDQVKFFEDDVALLSASLPETVAHEVFEELAHHAPDPWVRLRGAQAMVEIDAVAASSALIDLLAADVPLLIKLEASGTLRDFSGQRFGFDPMRTPDEEREAIASWRAWLRTSYPGEP